MTIALSTSPSRRPHSPCGTARDGVRECEPWPRYSSARGGTRDDAMASWHRLLHHGRPARPTEHGARGMTSRPPRRPAVSIARPPSSHRALLARMFQRRFPFRPKNVMNECTFFRPRLHGRDVGIRFTHCCLLRTRWYCSWRGLAPINVRVAYHHETGAKMWTFGFL